MSLVLISSLCAQVEAQELRDYNWQMGSRTYGDTVPGSLEFNFNNGKLHVSAIFREAGMFTTSASVASGEGAIQLYTNGCNLYDSQNRIIEGGEELNPGVAYDAQCSSANGYASPEGAIFLNIGDSIIMLYHTGVEYATNPLDVFVNVLYETKVVHHGLDSFSVIQKNKPIVEDTLVGGLLEATKSISDGWWLITHRRSDNLYYKLRISEENVDVNTQRIGVPSTRNSDGSGQAAFSPDGSKYAYYSRDEQLFLMDFDRQTGELSNFKQIHVVDSGNIGGVCFSPNSRYLYVSSQLDLYQVDTEAEDIQTDGIIHIDHYDGFLAPLPTTFYLMQLGPDCRIYMIPNNGVDVMHVIHHPDRRGTACEFEQHGIQLPVYNSISLPNFPNYRLDVGPPCDSSITTGLADVFPAPLEARVWPNPAVDHLQVSIPGADYRNVTFTMYDLFGNLIHQQHLQESLATINLFHIGVVPGVYFYTIRSTDDREHMASGKVIVVR